MNEKNYMTSQEVLDKEIQFHEAGIVKTETCDRRACQFYAEYFIDKGVPANYSHNNNPVLGLKVGINFSHRIIQHCFGCFYFARPDLYYPKENVTR